MFCWACLDNPCNTSNDDYGIVDAIFFTSQVMDHTSMVSSTLPFCWCPSKLHKGIYDISANASSLWMYSWWTHLSCRSLCTTALTNWNKQTRKWKLMGGDIIDVCPLFPFTLSLSSYLVGSHTLNLLPYHWMIQWEHAKYQLGSQGQEQFSVSTRKDIVSYCFPHFLSLWLKNRNSPIHAFLEKSPRWPNPTVRLPLHGVW